MNCRTLMRCSHKGKRVTERERRGLLPGCSASGSWMFTPGEVDGLEQLLVSRRRDLGIWGLSIKIDSLLDGVEERGTIRTGGKMLFDLPAPCRIEICVQVVANVEICFLALHQFITSFDSTYGLSSDLRNARALRSRDFVASTDSFRIFAVSSFDFPSRSLNTKTIL